MTKAEDAASYLVHYFRMVLKHQGMGISADQIREIEKCVDLIIEAAVEATLEKVAAGTGGSI